jgi:hypothetical protein
MDINSRMDIEKFNGRFFYICKLKMEYLLVKKY